MKTHPYSILKVPTTQLAKMSIGLKFVELTADVLEIFFIKWYVLVRRLIVRSRSSGPSSQPPKSPMAVDIHAMPMP